MSRNLTTSALTYLGTAQSVRVAHLIRLELYNSSDVDGKAYIYLTDYASNVVWNSQTYEAGKVTSVGDVRQGQGLTNYKVTVGVAGEYPSELARGLVGNAIGSYVGKDIEILRAYLDDSGNIIPFDSSSSGPMQYFVGDIASIEVTEGVVAGNSTVKWSCAGKFADFQKINGRITDDASHRGLTTDINSGQTTGSNGAKLVSHQTDRGFQHANQSVQIMSKYLGTQTSYKMKKRHWWQSDKLVEFQEVVEKELELGVDLSAKYLPKVYGVRKIPGIPVFIDALKDNPNKVYIVYAFAEGEIDSFLNLYIDDEPVVCANGTDSISNICEGSQAAGDTLSATMTGEGYDNQASLAARIFRAERLGGDGIGPLDEFIETPPVIGVDRTTGTTHTKTEQGADVINVFRTVNSTGVKRITTYHGKSDQNADPVLVDIASQGNFLLQETWAENYALSNGLDWGIPAEKKQAMDAYWDENCKLLDTAYAIVTIVLSEEETQMPNIEAVVSGSLVSTFNTAGTIETTDQYTLNPVWHTLAYMRDKICGGELDIDLLDIASFSEVAATMDVLATSYDNDFLSYWRYCGWKNAPVDQEVSGHDPQKTIMQCNTLLLTEDTVTKNLEGLLRQFDGTLNILGGKYHLSVENNDATIADINITEVIGNVKTKDLSNKNKWNSVQASITDPAQAWGTNQVSFFDQGYLDQDNGIKKKGNIQFRHLTNYYTARAWAKIQLAKSRFSREISFTTYYKYTFLYPNANVTFTYPRFNYDKKKFRVKSTNLRATGLVEVVLEDYDDSIYDEVPSDNDLSSVEPSVINPPPTGLEYVPLPDARFSIAEEHQLGVNGILVWDTPTTSSNILRYEVRDWLEVSGNTGVPKTQVIEDDGVTKNYILIKGLSPSTDYSFKVSSLDYSGSFSVFAVTTLTTGTDVSVLLYPEVTGFTASNAIAGVFTGSDLNLQWDLVEDIPTSAYQIQIHSVTPSALLGTYSVPNSVSTFSYTFSLNKADYASANGSALGAYRDLTAKIRVTNGALDTSPSFRYSDWTDINI
jgi:hypothetical protein